VADRKRSSQDALYEEAAAAYGAALERLARAYERDADRRQDLLQDIHVELWRSLARFDGRCALRTWVYRVAQNTVISRVLRPRASSPTLVSLDEMVATPDRYDQERFAGERLALDRLLSLIHELEPLDRQVILLYLEGLDAAAIGEITGLSGRNVATKVHRTKQVLSRRFYRNTTYGA
jgi:RNA polymerase sigma-70 factor, ECF subfamily